MTVSNSTVLISLIRVGRIELIKNIYKNIIITEVIRDEITREDELYKSEIRIFNDLLDSFILVKKTAKVKNYGLHDGENSCLSLCAEINDKISAISWVNSYPLSSATHKKPGRTGPTITKKQKKLALFLTSLDVTKFTKSYISFIYSK